MWADFVHHLTLHFTIVLPMVLAMAGLYSLRSDDEVLVPLIQWTGLFTLAVATITVATGLVAGGFSGGEEALQHHRYLGIMTFCVIAIAAIAYDQGVRRDITDLRAYGVTIWWVASVSVIGTGHYGGLGGHLDVVPF